MLSPLPPDRWNPETAAHLALRAGFGQTPDESKKWSQQGLEATLNHMAETALKALGDAPDSMRVANAQEARNLAQNGGTPTHNLAQTTQKTPEPQVIPPPAPTPPPRLTGGFPMDGSSHPMIGKILGG
jgi:hypothetical protein